MQVLPKKPLFVIIGAMQAEIDPFLNQLAFMPNCHERLCGLISYTGVIKLDQHNQTDVLICVSGIGKVAAAQALTQIIERYHPQYVINIGSAGALSISPNSTQVVIGTNYFQHDVDLTAFGYPQGTLPNQPDRFEASPILISQLKLCYLNDPKLEFGSIASGDQFIGEKTKVHSLGQIAPDLKAVDMESGSLAQVCFQYKLGFVAIRALTDSASEGAATDFKKNLESASFLASKVALNLIQKMASQVLEPVFPSTAEIHFT